MIIDRTGRPGARRRRRLASPCARARRSAIVGESGCGKTTLIRVLVRLIDADRRGRSASAARTSPRPGASELEPIRREMQMVFQDPQASLNPRKRVGQILATPLRMRGVPRDKLEPTRAAQLLERVGPVPRAPQPLPARVLRRPAPADRDRPRAGRRSAADPARRAGLGARRLDPGAGHQPARRAPGRVPSQLRVRRPRPVRRAPRLRPDRGHVPRQADGGLARPRSSTTSRSTRTRRRCSSAIPIPDPKREPRARPRRWSAASRRTRSARRRAAASTPAARARPRSAARSSRS